MLFEITGLPRPRIPQKQSLLFETADEAAASTSGGLAVASPLRRFAPSNDIANYSAVSLALIYGLFVSSRKVKTQTVEVKICTIAPR